ncbi:hypothetical protein [Legionella quateirensis]|uniref:Uncharacterized protein n=1 Tax=Legionella quateirensis TaxID=45072 RepID=A0A378KRJ9_9GAMM|nr:hypothetical protein [Legionella quateirensis]KTD54766.1 hypothetical protein Lqua_0273 [Legionella quateirensis]STY16946.1 Uncharacterised protein [Legionella quateirensis]
MKKSGNSYTCITIETLILVAVWEGPFIFQGSFNLCDKNRQTEQLLFYRCERDKAEKMDILEHEFSPYDYQFTHLYRVTETTQRDVLDQCTEDARYLLKYALHVSLIQMITNNKHSLTYMDEIALMSLTKRVQLKLSKGTHNKEDDAIGFAVAMDFNPSEPTGQAAVVNLLSYDS